MFSLIRSIVRHDIPGGQRPIVIHRVYHTINGRFGTGQP